MNSLEQIRILRHLLYWTALILPMAIITGGIVALFLWLLELVTVTRHTNTWLLFLLPPAGLMIRFLYIKFGSNTEAGNNLVIDEVHQPKAGVPVRMAPLVLATTLLTHLFGGSAGREGTAVQMGGSMAALLSGMYKLDPREYRILLMCGMAAGFGAVFGTPVAGAVFAMEVLSIGRIKYEALLPCFIASVLADITCSSLGIRHTLYTLTFNVGLKPWTHLLRIDLLLLFKVVVAAIAFGLAAYIFAQTTHFIKTMCARFLTNKYLSPIIGGMVIIGISYAINSFDYLGLGVTNPKGGVSILSAFHINGADTWSWFWKLLLTAITLGTGFKGGEVTPLFFIGATLGNTLASISGSPIDLFAALGFIAVFAGATNTPLACTLMGVELFGGDNLFYYAAACFTAYYFSGHTGIYSSQKSAVSKLNLSVRPKHKGQQLSDNREQRPDIE